MVAKRNGVVKYRGPLQPGAKQFTHTCQGDSLRLYREDLAIQLTHVKQGT